MIEPEQLKVIAEAQGYKPRINKQGCVRLTFPHRLEPEWGVWMPYRPDNDRAQLDELLEWLGLRGWKIFYDDTCGDWNVTKPPFDISYDKDRITAIIMAAVKEVESHI